MVIELKLAGARLHRRGAFANPLVWFVATIFLNDRVTLRLKAKGK